MFVLFRFHLRSSISSNNDHCVRPTSRIKVLKLLISRFKLKLYFLYSQFASAIRLFYYDTGVFIVIFRPVLPIQISLFQESCCQHKANNSILCLFHCGRYHIYYNIKLRELVKLNNLLIFCIRNWFRRLYRKIATLFNL